MDNSVRLGLLVKKWWDGKRAVGDQHQLGHTFAATTRRFSLTRGTSAGNGAAIQDFLSEVYVADGPEARAVTP